MGKINHTADSGVGQTVPESNLSYKPLLQLIAEDRRTITYRPRFAAMVDSAMAAILLQQMVYWWELSNEQPFYKFRDTCKHKMYRKGDSWCEELEWSGAEFDGALKIIGTKIVKGVGKNEALAYKVPQRNGMPDSEYYVEMKKAIAHCVVYWTDSNRITWYQVNSELLGNLILLNYLGNSTSLKYLRKSTKSNYLKSETTTETTKKIPTSDDAGVGKSPKKERKPRKKAEPKEPKPKAKDVIFDTIADCAYGITDTTNVSNGSTIGAIKRIAVKQFTLEYGNTTPEIIAQSIRMFAGSRRGFPQYQTTFEAPYVAYLQSHRPAIQALLSGTPPSKNGKSNGSHTAGLDDVTGGAA